MIRWFAKTLISQVKYQLKLNHQERLLNLKFILVMYLILLGFSKNTKTLTNSFFNLNEILSFAPQIRKIMFFHNKFFRCLLDPKHRGIRAWEYGLFLTKVKLKKGMKVLDLGAGASALPFYLYSCGLDVTAFDLDDPLEPVLDSLVNKYPKLKYDRGTLTKLPYKQNFYDLILCITTIEHLDFDFEKKKPYSYQTFLKRTKKSLFEMVRLLKKGGRLFLTSDLYFNDTQSSDNYPQAYFYQGRIGASYKVNDFKKVFLDTLQSLNCKLVGAQDYNFQKIFKDQNRENFRGRCFTTFSIYAEKT